MESWFIIIPLSIPGGSDSKESACNEGDSGLIPGSLGISPGEGNGCPLLYFFLKNSMGEEPTGYIPMGSERVRHN